MPRFTFPRKPQAASSEPTWPADVLARFLTVGGATVDVQSVRFTTRYTFRGRPYVDAAREVDGFAWQCLGCDATGATDGSNPIQFDYGRYLPNERDLARREANAHAERCRAMPKPQR
ncbi:hypothetical protein [Streptosporangium sp. G12]